MRHCGSQQHDNGGDWRNGKSGVDRRDQGKRGYGQGENREKRNFARTWNEDADGAAAHLLQKSSILAR